MTCWCVDEIYSGRSGREAADSRQLRLERHEPRGVADRKETFVEDSQERRNRQQRSRKATASST